MFYKNTDFLPVLNEYFGAQFHGAIDGEYGRLKYDILGVISEPQSFSVTAFKLGDYYSETGAPSFSFFTAQDDSLLDLMPVYEYRDMSDVLTVSPEERALPLYTEAGFYKDGNYYYQVDSRYEDVSGLNADLLRVCDAFYEHIKTGDFESITTTDNLNEYWKVYIGEAAIGFTQYDHGVYFDRETLELISMADLFDISKANFHDNFSSPIEEYDYSKIYQFWWNPRDNGIVNTDYFDISVSGVKEKYKDFVLELYADRVQTYYN
jgi:hypothetical protein